MARRPLPLLVALLLAAALAPACATTSAAQASESDAERALREGNQALEVNNYEDATRLFDYVRTRYPFDAASVTAELRLADTDFQREEFLEARDRYNNFVKLHPTSDRVDYAAFRAALTHYKEIPGDWFLIPASFEKDQQEVQNALRELRAFVKTYPESAHQEEAKKAIADTLKRLGNHEMYAAEFYAKRGRWKAVVTRLSTLLERYPGSGHEEKALFDLHAAYVQLGDQDKARATLQRIVETLPGTPAAERARGLLGS
jgi:outer membrane protein assembly factor BamD